MVFGTGPLGLAVAGRLASSGRRVRLVNRSGKADAPRGVEVIPTDVTDPVAARSVCLGAAIVFHCASGPYGQWEQTLPPIMNGIIEGAAAAGARLVYGDNRYMYGPVDGPIREDLPHRPIGPTPRIAWVTNPGRVLRRNNCCVHSNGLKAISRKLLRSAAERFLADT